MTTQFPIPQGRPSRQHQSLVDNVSQDMYAKDRSKVAGSNQSWTADSQGLLQSWARTPLCLSMLNHNSGKNDGELWGIKDPRTTFDKDEAQSIHSMETSVSRNVTLLMNIEIDPRYQTVREVVDV